MAEFESPTSAVPLLSGLLADAESVTDLCPRHAFLAEFLDAPLDLGLHVGDGGAEVSEVLGSRRGRGAVEALPGERGGVGHTSTIVDSERESIDVDDLDSLDGKHHLYCKRCYPDFVARPLGAPLGVPFTAGLWSTGSHPGPLAERRPQHPQASAPPRADPTTPCATCGSL